MADKYDALIDSVISSQSGGRDKYDEMIDSASSGASKEKTGGLVNYLTSTDLSGAPKADIPAQLARLGQFANKGNQDLADIMSEESGRIGARVSQSSPMTGRAITRAGLGSAEALSLLSTAMLPQSRLGVASYAIAPALKAYQFLRGPASEQGVVRQGINRATGAINKLLANVPESSGEAAAGNPELLLNPTTDEAVSAAYDKFHNASGTMSRREFVAASDNPFDTVARAQETMRDADNKLKAGKLSVQEAVNASQAARIIRDLKSRGNEMAQEIADTAEVLKNKFDDFIEQGMEASGERIPIGQDMIMSKEAQAIPGFFEWQNARQLARNNYVASDFSHAIPRNINGMPSVARFWGALNSGIIAGAGTGAGIAGPPGAAIGALIGGGLGAASVSPMAHGAAIRAAGAVGNALGSPTAIGLAGFGANAAMNKSYVVRPKSSLEDAYRNQ